jgi:hypothetical protein
MVSFERRAKDIAATIKKNPTEVRIHQTVKIPDGGGFREVRDTSEPLTVRIYQNRTSQQRTESATIGTKQTDYTWGMLADQNAGIISGADLIVDAPGYGKFHIRTVIAQIVEHKVAGYQCELERIL